jgi:aminopeptidase-like protein
VTLESPLRIDSVVEGFDFAEAGERMYALAKRLFPICRSITGPGLRETLGILGEGAPLGLTEVPSGTPVFDWTVPKEWIIREAWIKGPDGSKVVDFGENNLHVVGYSTPVKARMSLAELRPRLHSLPDQPGRIPFRSSYYKEDWGFCLTNDRLRSLPEGEYEVRIDSELKDGSLTYGEWLLPGASEDEVLIFAHACHPSLANDNLSGLGVAAELAGMLRRCERKLTYRFLFAPTVIGPITWLALNEAKAGRIRHGLVLALLGDAGHPTYKRSRRGNAPIDRAMAHVLARRGGPHVVKDFSPYGYDERQFCSPGFDLPVGCFMRSPNGTFPEYHNSGDDLGFLKPESLADSLRCCAQAISVLEGDGLYLNQNPKCEPRLGKRGIYDGLKGKPNLGDTEMALLWVLNYCDGKHTLSEIAERAGMAFAAIRKAADILESCGLLKRSETESRRVS